MDANDLPYAVAQTWDQLLVDKQAWASGCFYEMEYPNGNKRTMVRPPVIFEETELPPLQPRAVPGRADRAGAEEPGLHRRAGGMIRRAMKD